MAVAGYFLIEGLSQFAGSAAAKNMLIVGGVLFQITESLCFIAASALTYHSLRWRYILFSLGLVLFSFSIGVMTLAQKTALQTGEAQAQANDEKRGHIRSQITSLEEVIASYRFNAEKQSRSIYKDSRALGQDSINRAAELEEKKMRLSEELFALNTARRQTSSDFFHRLEEVTGLPEKSTEFYFLVLRSLLLELSGIILMSFGANLRAYNKLVMNSGTQADMETKKPWLKKIFERAQKAPVSAISTTVKAVKNDSASTTSTPVNTSVVNDPPAITAQQSRSNSATVPEDDNKDDAGDKLEYWESASLKERVSATVTETGHQLTYLATMVMDLYEQQLLDGLNPASIKEGLNRYCSQKVSQDTAGILSKMINKRLDETC